jgi:hypothetical protein
MNSESDREVISALAIIGVSILSVWVGFFGACATLWLILFLMTRQVRRHGTEGEATFQALPDVDLKALIE